MASGEEIQAALRDFVSKWTDYSGTEKSEAQTFLNELFACFGGDRRALGAKFEDFRTSAGFMDLHWPGICIVEMKAPSHELRVAQQQVERYWRESSDMEAGVKAARYVVICNFRQFEIWELGSFPNRPVTSFDLADLPDRYDALGFLAGPHVEASFTEHYRELTQEAAKVVAEVFHSLVDRSAAPPRTEICSTEQIGLTKLYNAVDDGAWTELKALHRNLDEAVAGCYGWPRTIAQDGPEIVRRLTELHRLIIEGRPYAPFAD